MRGLRIIQAYRQKLREETGGQWAIDPDGYLRALEEAIRRRRKYIWACQLHTAGRFVLGDGRKYNAGACVCGGPTRVEEALEGLAEELKGG